MTFSHRALPGTQSYRPDTQVMELEGQNLALFVRLWGSESLLGDIKEAFYSGYRGPLTPDDPDHTVPRLRSSIVSRPSETVGFAKLAAGLRQVNTFLLEKENARQWRSLAEVAAVLWTAHTIHWAVCGEFKLFLRSEQESQLICQNGMPMGSTVLPLQGLGIEPAFSVSQGQAPLEPGYQLMILSAAHAPDSFLRPGKFSLAQAMDEISVASSGEPIWLALTEMEFARA